MLILNSFIPFKISVYAKSRGRCCYCYPQWNRFQSVPLSDPASFNFRGRKKFAQAIAICTKPANHRSMSWAFMSISYEISSSLNLFGNCAADRDTTPLHRDRPIPAPQRPHSSWYFAEPHQRPCPPNFARQRHHRFRSSILPPIRKQKPYLTQQFIARHSKQSADSRILQRRHRQSAPLQNRSQPSRNPRAKRALRIKKQPPSRVSPLPVRKLRCQRNHGPLLLRELCDLCVKSHLEPKAQVQPSATNRPSSPAR